MAAHVYLYVPGHRPDRFAKAVASGTDAVILDLEDAVPFPAKDSARGDVRSFLADTRPGAVELWVRINDGQRGRADLAAIAELASLAGVIVPKARPATLAALHADAPHVGLVPLIESATAIAELSAIAGAAGVRSLAIGEVDLAADLSLGNDVPDAVLWSLRTQLVVAAAAAGIAAPLGPVARDINDLERFETVVRQLRGAGFGAVQAILVLAMLVSAAGSARHRDRAVRETKDVSTEDLIEADRPAHDSPVGELRCSPSRRCVDGKHASRTTKVGAARGIVELVFATADANRGSPSASVVRPTSLSWTCNQAKCPMSHGPTKFGRRIRPCGFLGGRGLRAAASRWVLVGR